MRLNKTDNAEAWRLGLCKELKKHRRKKRAPKEEPQGLLNHHYRRRRSRKMTASCRFKNSSPFDFDFGTRKPVKEFNPCIVPDEAPLPYRVPDTPPVELFASVPASFANVLTAAKGGNIESCYRLALIYHHGHGVGRDPGQALRWATVAAETGHARALAFVGYCHSLGAGTAVNQDEALRCYRLSAAQRYPLAEYTLGNFYQRGFGVKKNLPLAVRWYGRAARHGHVKAMIVLAEFYEKGEEIFPRIERANSWWLRAAEHGNREAMGKTANANLYGRGEGDTFAGYTRWIDKLAAVDDKRVEWVTNYDNEFVPIDDWDKGRLKLPFLGEPLVVRRRTLINMQGSKKAALPEIIRDMRSYLADKSGPDTLGVRQKIERNIERLSSMQLWQERKESTLQ